MYQKVLVLLLKGTEYAHLYIAHLASTIGKIIHEGTVICLDGELGVGKTLFVRALARTLGVESDVTSPTFNLMNIYEAACPIVHFDLYRIESV